MKNCSNEVDRHWKVHGCGGGPGVLHSINPPDILIRDLAKAEEMGSQSIWQNGPYYIQLPREECLINRELSGFEVQEDEKVLSCLAMLCEMGQSKLEKIKEMGERHIDYQSGYLPIPFLQIC